MTLLVPDEWQWVQEHCVGLCCQGILRRAQWTEWQANIVLVKGVQSGQDYRVCTKFTDLNAYTLPRFYPLPDWTVVHDQFAYIHIFSVMDIKSGFHNVPVSSEKQPRLGMVTQDGLFIWQRMPMGVKGAPYPF